MARPKGLEPLAHCLEGSCSIRLSYGRMHGFGAGDGNRTHMASLEGWSSTTELHLHISERISIYNALPIYHKAWEKSSLYLKDFRQGSGAFLPERKAKYGLHGAVGACVGMQDNRDGALLHADRAAARPA